MVELRSRHESMRQTNELVEADIERALAFLPAGGLWGVAAGSTPAVFARSGQTFFTLRVEDDASRVVLGSRKVDPEKLAVRLEWDQPASMSGQIRRYGTKWIFRADGDDDFRLVLEGAYSVQGGRDGTEVCDREETLARDLAELAGWTGIAISTKPDASV
jgi:hypothetical protein